MTDAASIELQTADGHRWSLAGCVPDRPHTALLWLPALGVGAKHYLPFAQALAARGVAAYVHEWRGAGSSSLRAGRDCDWGYRELLELDLPVSAAALRRLHPGIQAIIGGHSLGGQLACCLLATAPETAQRIWLVASGAPYWRAFPFPHRPLLPLVYRFLPWLSDRNGALPGRRIGFGGNEARGLVRDWARTGLTGIYAGRGVDADLEAGMAQIQAPVQAVVMASDWLGPESSLRFMLSKLPNAHAQVEAFDGVRLGARADHFTWMKHPQPVADWLTTAPPHGEKAPPP